MFKIDKTEIHGIKIDRNIVQYSVNIDFHFDINGEKNIPKFLVTIYFSQIVGNDKRFMEQIKVAGPYDSVINTGQDNDDFWLNVNDTIGTEIDHRLFNVPPKERNVIIEKMFKIVEDAVRTLEIEL